MVYLGFMSRRSPLSPKPSIKSPGSASSQKRSLKAQSRFSQRKTKKRIKQRLARWDISSRGFQILKFWFQFKYWICLLFGLNEPTKPETHCRPARGAAKSIAWGTRSWPSSPASSRAWSSRCASCVFVRLARLRVEWWAAGCQSSEDNDHILQEMFLVMEVFCEPPPFPPATILH